ncbi:nucleotide exchange factor GrpE [Sphaerochaeta halotolerans]|jgi:molecular chaperone GrpE|uniref:Protein GrpE n=1 Tax=Sphaerochaeta halotolerans TaxID=2293840 RepID=A0A372MID4_9SPIR|nr:nucleotide exchange factor GrpE [Sphaerochaeta halotolerans]MBG0766030.1 nucleotide exchange factor GrpE [Spirochaetaceae bacterium]MDK2859924.1 molecular chaperone GrpE [Sphaerochaeta sp.]MDN5333010.1 molecular chaperone GrpE [Sphaerochaeta sp.]MXI87124.1 nucleotide exchange factor GrpE [Sphaerochaeta halotolerans]RFU95519.1 nucleotide exchange factor GrpE [Sphaerochaeta halotolerans]
MEKKQKEKSKSKSAQPDVEPEVKEELHPQESENQPAQEQEVQEMSELEQKELEIVRLKEQLATAQEEAASLKEQMLRDRADLENYRKRLIRDKEETVKFANENLIRDLLQPLDDLGRAIQIAESTKDYEKVHDGVVMVNKQLYSTLEKNWGLQKIDSVGKEFDPLEHEAYQVAVDDSLEHEVVLEEYAVGYKLHGRVLRPAKVKVGKPNI